MPPPATPTRIPPPPATATSVPPTATHAPSPPARLPLDILLAPRHVTAGGALLVRVRTAGRAHAQIDLTVVSVKDVTVAVSSGKGRKRQDRHVKRTVVLYRAALQGTADAKGRFSGRLRVAYHPATPVTATLVVTAQVAHVSVRRTLQVTIEPLPRTPLSVALPSLRVVGGETLVVRVRTAPRAHVLLDLRVAATRDRVIVVSAGKGRTSKRAHVARTVVLYRTTWQGVAGARGQLTTSLRVAYQPPAPAPATLAITAQAPGAETASQAIHITIAPPIRPCALPCTLTVGRAPQAVAVDATTGAAFVTDTADNTVSVLDASGRGVRASAAGLAPGMLAVDARTARVFVADTGSSAVSVLDATTGAVVRTVAVGAQPAAVAVDEGLGRAFVLSGNDRVSVLDARTGQVLRTVTVGNALSDLSALSPDTATRRVFVTDQANHAVDVLDALTGRVLASIRLDEIPVTVATDARDGHAFVARGDKVSMLDGVTGRVLRTARVGQAPRAIAVAARSGRVFVANEGDGTVSVLDARTGYLLYTITVGLQPRAIAIDERSGRVFVAGPGRDGVSALDVAARAVRRSVHVGPRVVTVAVDGQRGRVFVLSSGAGNGRGAVTIVGAG